MRAINRLQIPDILERKGSEWTVKFIASGNNRPSSSQYGHKEIRTTLIAMSNHKCFYCENLIKNQPTEVDHYIEISQYRHLAFIWENLYLSCEHCNNKFSNLVIPTVTTLDPCSHSDAEIENNLTFNDEFIDYIIGFPFGEQTIKKYKLDSPVLDHLRSMELKKFHKLLIDYLRTCNAEGGRALNALERQTLLSFSNRNRPFSFMFQELFKKHPI